MIIIRINGSKRRIIDKSTNNHISIYNLKENKDSIDITTTKESIKTLNKVCLYEDYYVISYTGIDKLKYTLKTYYYDLLMLFLFLILISIQSMFIYNIDIKHENKEIKNKIKYILKENNIHILSIKKSNKELNEISDRILSNNRDFLDFISIKKIGSKYIVSIEERIIKKDKKENDYCHIISSKDAVITSITTYKGQTLLEKGSSVKKGDIIISGEIILNEEIKDNICANGIVKGNTWYKISITYPLTIKEKIYTKREKINLNINNKYLKKIKYKEYDEKTLFEYKNIKLVKQTEYETKYKKIDTKNARNKAIDKAIDSLNNKLNKKIKIIDKKVLKEEVNNSKIYIELFIMIEEEIGQSSTFIKQESGVVQDE